MRRAALNIIVLLAAASGAAAYSSGPPPGRTGDAGLTCNASGCHESFGLGSGDVTLSLLDASSRVPATTWTVAQDASLVFRVTSGEPGRMRWGFELTALHDGFMAGSFDPGPNQLVQQDAQGHDDLSHGFGGTGLGQTTGFEWPFTWHPPATDVGTVTFFACANAANGNDTPLGDYIECTTFQLFSSTDRDHDGIH